MHGFRLFAVEARKNGSWKPVDMEKTGPKGDMHLHAHLDRHFTKLEGLDALSMMPALRHGEGETLPAISEHQGPVGSTNDPRGRWVSHSSSSQRRISFEMRYGRIGHFDWALGATSSDDRSLVGMATGNPVRGELFLPDSGQVGVLALETFNSANAAKFLSHWLRRIAMQAQSDDVASGDKGAAAWWPKFEPLPDWPRLEAMIKSPTTTTTLRLTKSAPAGFGARRKRKILVEAELTTRAEQRRAVAWAKRKYREHTGTAKTATLDSLTKVSGEDLSGLKFDEGLIILDDTSRADGKQKIGTAQFDDIFIYPITEDLRPDYPTWISEVWKAVSPFAAQLKTTLKLD